MEVAGRPAENRYRRSALRSAASPWLLAVATHPARRFDLDQAVEVIARAALAPHPDRGPVATSLAGGLKVEARRLPRANPVLNPGVAVGPEVPVNIAQVALVAYGNKAHRGDICPGL